VNRFLSLKLPNYLLRLQRVYGRSGATLQRDVIANCRFIIEEDVIHDNWNGGTYGHKVTLYLPLEELDRIELNEQGTIAEGICGDLNTLAKAVENEFFNAVHIEADDDNDPWFQRSIPFSAKPPVNPDNLSIWRKGLGRVFVSHRDKHKAEARELADALADYGICSFVAHETIPANEEWRKVIENGLETMEVMVLFLTDDFHESIWTMQEVGYALGKGTPIISLKLGKVDPPGFVNHKQALKGSIHNPIASAQALFPLIGKALGKEERLQDILITSFIESPSWSDTKVRFDRMAKLITKLTDEQLSRIIAGFRDNDQLSQCVHLTSHYDRLKKFLERTTGRTFKFEGNRITKIRPAPVAFEDDDVPF
jgi:hypothetical protein